MNVGVKLLPCCHLLKPWRCLQLCVRGAAGPETEGEHVGKAAYEWLGRRRDELFLILVAAVVAKVVDYLW
ncbi:hypothetical protein ACPXCP_38285 [Streptomyces sp. DT20]|uniref:hypothetical protein n=1 Tax=Streptomyces sp. DT20 TaxID=3416519 RepID=UPI003CEE30C4